MSGIYNRDDSVDEDDYEAKLRSFLSETPENGGRGMGDGDVIHVDDLDAQVRLVVEQEDELFTRGSLSSKSNPKTKQTIKMPTEQEGKEFGVAIVGMTPRMRRTRLWRISACVATVVVMLIVITVGFSFSRRQPPKVGSEESINSIHDATEKKLENSHSKGTMSEEIGGGPVAVPVVPTVDISVVCSASYIQIQDGYRECLYTCSSAACCFVNDDDNSDNDYDNAVKPRNCNSAFRDICHMYEGCASLGSLEYLYFYYDGSSSSSSSTTTTTNGASSKIPVPENIIEDGSPEKLPSLSSSYSYVPEAPSNLRMLCDDGKLDSPDGLVVCRDVCLAGSCCWGMGSDNCYALNEDACKGYVKCFQPAATSGDRRWEVKRDEHMDIRPFHNRSRAMVGAMLDVHQPAPKILLEDLAEVCDEDRSSECWAKCAKRMCCFMRADEDGSCVEHSAECVAYDACRVLLG